MTPEKFIELTQGNDDASLLASAVIEHILSIPGVYEAVTVAAVKAYGHVSTKEVYNMGVPLVGDLAYCFVWNTLQGLEA